MPRKNKPQRQEVAAPPTPEWQARRHVERIEAERTGDWRDKQEHTLRVVPKLVSWHRHGWIDGEQAKALAQWLQAWETWGAEHVKSCLDTTPRSSAEACRPERIALAGRRYNAIRLGVLGACGPIITQTVWAWMRSDEQIHYGEELGVGINEGYARARSMVERVADACERVVKG